MPAAARNRLQRHAPERIAAFTLSGVYGTERSRTPVASNTAFEIADGTTAAAGSPAPHGARVRPVDQVDARSPARPGR